MAYTVLNPQPAQRAADAVAGDITAPGLYPDEVAVTLDSGEDIAVYVERFWMDNNQGAQFYASARLINADGSTKLCPAGKQVVTEVTDCVGQDRITLAGIDVISQAYALAMLGEPIPTISVQSGDETVQVTPVMWPDIVLANMSIRHAIAVVNASGVASNLTTLLAQTPSPSPAPSPA